MTLQEAQAGLAHIKQKIREHEISNDMYCLSYQSQIDEQELMYWKKAVAKLTKENDNA